MSVGGSIGVVARAGDMSGDGLPDLAIADGDGLHVILDPAPGHSTLGDADLCALPPFPDAVYTRFAAADFDGDGVRDFATTAVPNAGFSGAAVYLFHGATGPIAAADAWATYSSSAPRSRGFALAAVADSDDDGLDELLLANLALDGASTSTISLIEPETSTSLDDALLLLGSDAGGLLGYALASDDVDGDGTADILAAAADVGDAAERVVVFLGPFRDVHAVEDADVALSGRSATDRFGLSTTFDPVLDTNGDGIVDLLIGAPGASAAYVFQGPFPASIDADAATATIVGGEGEVGMAVSTGDLDGDGRGDILLPVAGSGAALFYGPAAGSYDVARGDAQVSAALDGGIGAADLDGDGVDDMVLWGEELWMFRGTTW